MIIWFIQTLLIRRAKDTSNVMPKKKILKAHTDVPPNPIVAKKGDRGSVLKYDSRAEWRGWLQCSLDDGQIGWISESYLEIHETRVTFKKDYNAIEIQVQVGEDVEILREDNGWAWIRRSDDVEGWIPCQCFL